VLVSTITAITTFAFGAEVDGVRSTQWHLDFLSIAQAHQLTTGTGITIGLIDTGVDSTHPDLEGSILRGIVLDPSGQGDGTTDRSGHGTAMAGLIAGHGRGSSGVLGIAPASKILPVVDTASGGPTSPDLTADGINWAIDHGATVINVSASGGPTVKLQNAVERAIRDDVVVVAAAGNAPSPIIGFPANYPGVLAVGASDQTGAVANVSARGSGMVLLAPGVDIMTTRLNSTYGTGTGTSDSAAIVSGAVALVRSRFPQLSAVEVVHRLTATATDRGAPGRDVEYGYGVLNVVAALTADVPPLSPAASSAAPSTPGVAAPPENGQGSRGLGIVALVGVAVVIMAFALIVRARRHRAGRGQVP
jgi:type VII secretion-associated serine protease mycosin